MRNLLFIFILCVFSVCSCVTQKSVKPKELVKADSIINSNTNTDFNSNEPKKDSDGDGIIDELDKCPDEFSLLDNGCPRLAESESEKEESRTSDFIRKKSESRENSTSKKQINDVGEENVKIVDNTKTDLVKDNIGLMAYSIPDEMKVGEFYSVKLRISKENNKVEIIDGDRNIPIYESDKKSKVVIESIRVEPIMSAKLICDESEFKLESVSTELQNIEATGYTEWQWKIMPIKSGESFLKLIVKVRIIEEGQDFYKDITVFDGDIKIKPNLSFTTKNWLSQYWQWLMSTIVIPIFIFFWKKRNEKKKS